MHRASQPVDELQIVEEGERDGRHHFSRGIERQQVRGRQGMNICLRAQIEQLANLATALTSVHPPEKRTKSANRASTRRKTRIMTRIQIDLPEATARAAREAGLLTPEALAGLLNDALRRRQAADALLTIADRVAAAGIPPMTMEEIDAEVKAARAERRKRAGSR